MAGNAEEPVKIELPDEPAAASGLKGGCFKGAKVEHKLMSIGMLAINSAPVWIQSNQFDQIRVVEHLYRALNISHIQCIFETVWGRPNVTTFRARFLCILLEVSRRAF